MTPADEELAVAWAEAAGVRVSEHRYASALGGRVQAGRVVHLAKRRREITIDWQNVGQGATALSIFVWAQIKGSPLYQHASEAQAMFSYEIDRPCALIEIDLAAVEALRERSAQYREVSRQPSVVRDIAVILARVCPAGEVLDAIRKTGGESLVSVELFDRYEGEGIPQGKVSLAVRLVFQRVDRTLKDSEVRRLTERVVQMLAHRFGGELR